MSRIEVAEKKVDINKFIEETSVKQESHVIYETFAMEEECIVILILENSGKPLRPKRTTQ